MTTTQGNLFIATPNYCCADVDSTIVTDSKSNSYAVAVSDFVDGGSGITHVQVRYAAAATGGSSHTFTLTLIDNTQTPFGQLAVTEVSGAAASPLDKTAIGQDNAGTSHTTASTSTTAQANELLHGAGASAGLVTTLTADPGPPAWTSQSSCTPCGWGLTATRIVSATGTYAFPFTTDVSEQTASAITTWKESSSSRQRCIGCEIDKKVIGH